jgi:3-methyladenine DNA glycosylase AlkC
MSDYVALKLYFNDELASRLSNLIQHHYKDFPSELFISRVKTGVDGKELKARVEVITDELYKHLPTDYPEAINILLKILGPENNGVEGMFTKGYFLMPVAKFVEKYGHGHFDLSIEALYEITKRHTSEYAIRPYLNLDPDGCLKYFEKWLADANPHVRRLVSEGTRPRLPWAKKIGPIQNDPVNNLCLLKPIMNDPSLYVQKSVANHINDLTKDFPSVVIAWLEVCLENPHNVNGKVVKHGLRTLLKKENAEANRLVMSLK